MLVKLLVELIGTFVFLAVIIKTGELLNSDWYCSCCRHIYGTCRSIWRTL